MEPTNPAAVGIGNGAVRSPILLAAGGITRRLIRRKPNQQRSSESTLATRIDTKTSSGENIPIRIISQDVFGKADPVRIYSSAIAFALGAVLLAAASGHADTITLSTPGNGSVTVPEGYMWTDITVQCWSGGGGGGLEDSYYGAGGGGGGGGAYGSATYSALGAGQYDYSVGGGGGLGSNGGDTYWNTPSNQSSYDVHLAGGAAGSLGSASYGALGGTGGLVEIGTGYDGGSGGETLGGTHCGGGGGGGSAGVAGDGGPGGVGYSYVVGAEGSSFGPANGGTGQSFWNAGAAGSDGEIILTYSSEAVPAVAPVPLPPAVWTAALTLGIAGAWTTLHPRRAARPN